MAIKAYNAGTNNNLIDTTDKFLEGDMLVFDISKNLFVKGISSQLAQQSDITQLQSLIDQLGTSTTASVTAQLEQFKNDLPDGDFATQAYVDQQLANAASGGQLDLSGFVTESELSTAIDNIVHPPADWNTILNAPTLFSGSWNDLSDAPIMFTGNYDDLQNKPTLFSGSYTDLTDKPNLFSGNYNDLINRPNVFSGNYNDLYNVPTVPSDVSHLTDITNLLGATDYQNLTNKPTIPSDINQLTDVDGLLNNSGSGSGSGSGGSGFSGAYADLTGKPTLFSGSFNDLTGTPNLFSGLYADLVGKPTVPADISDLTDTTNLLGGGGVTSYNDLTDKPALFDGQFSSLTGTPVFFSGDFNDLINKPNFFSGDYTDLTNKPTIPSVLTDLGITDGTSGQILSTDGNGGFSFVPASTGSYGDSDVQAYLTNNDYATESWVAQQITNVGSGGGVDLSSYVTDTELQTALNALPSTYFSGDYNDLTNKPNINIPTNVSAFNNDAGYLTSVGPLNYDNLQNKPTIPADVSDLTDTTNLLGSGGGGSTDLTGYATETYVQQQISTATLGAVSSINDLTDVAIDGTETANHVLMYNAVNQLWENVDLDEDFATRAYVTEQVAQVVSGGQLDLSGYATENYVDQKILERGEHFSGDYNDLVNTPNLFSGDYNDLANVPAGNNDLRMQLVGQELQLINIEPEPDSVISSVDLADLGVSLAANISYNNLANLPSLFSGDYADLNNLPNLFSGSYTDLANKPYIPSIAGLATEQYVNDKHAEPTIYGDKLFTGSVTFADFRQQRVSVVGHEASKRELVLALQTTNAVPTEALLNSGNPIAIADNSTSMFKATFVCTSASSSASFIIRGIVANPLNSDIKLIGTNILETIADDGETWSADITVDTAENSLDITITGSDATTVDWTIFMELTEVKR